QADELHSYEEGIQALSQCMLLDYGNPKHLERAMETTRALTRLVGVNAAGHHHIRSTYFSGTRTAEDEPWAGSKPYSFLILHPALMLVQFNGSPEIKKLVLDSVDGTLAHHRNGRIYGDIRFATDRDEESGLGRMWPAFWAA